MAKKPAQQSAQKSAKTSAAPAKDAKVTAAAKPEDAPAAADTPKKPAVPPRPVPPHQQFLSKSGHGGTKPQALTKGRIFRHQGR